MTAGDNIEVINPFSHPRALLADFALGEKILQNIFQMLQYKKLVAASPLVVIHPMEKTEGGLTVIEHRALRELAIGAGARDAIIYQGPQLSIHNFDFEQLKALDVDPLEGEHNFSSAWLNLLLLIMVIALFFEPIWKLLQSLISYFI